MDSFSIIQHFFTRMNCNSCMQPLRPEGIQLIREEEGVFIVSVTCQACHRQIGIAMVGLEQGGPDQPVKIRPRYRDPELTPREIRRLSQFAPIREDDVLSAHHFIQSLDKDWMKHIPTKIRERYTTPQTESPGQ